MFLCHYGDAVATCWQTACSFSVTDLQGLLSSATLLAYTQQRQLQNGLVITNIVLLFLILTSILSGIGAPCGLQDCKNGVYSFSWPPLPPIDTIWAVMIVWRTRGHYRTARAVLEAIIAFSAMHTYYEQLLQVKQICLCVTGFTSLCLDAYVFLCSLVFHCMHVVLL